MNKVKDLEHLRQIFKNTEDDSYLEEYVDGILILRKYDPQTTITSAEHDIIYFGFRTCEDFINNGLTVEDAKELAKRNWIIKEGAFAAFV